MKARELQAYLLGQIKQRTEPGVATRFTDLVLWTPHDSMSWRTRVTSALTAMAKRGEISVDWEAQTITT